MSDYSDVSLYELDEDYRTLVSQQGYLERLRFTSIFPISEDALAMEEPRLNRLMERARQLGRDYAEDVATWVKTNPVSLTNQILVKDLSKIESVVTVWVKIGDPESKRTRAYPVHAGDLTIAGGAVTFNLPESVAEEFRQQGRRQLQREHAALMATQSHL